MRRFYLITVDQDFVSVQQIEYPLMLRPLWPKPLLYAFKNRLESWMHLGGWLVGILNITTKPHIRANTDPVNN